MGATAGILGAANTASTFIAQQRQATAVTRQAAFESQLADLTAKDAIARGAFQAQQRERAGKVTIGAQRAAYAASGVDPNSGSAVDVQENEAKFSELDAQTIRNNAAREAWGYTTEAALGSMAAKNEAQNLRAQSYSTLLTGAVNAYGLYSDSKNKIKATKGAGSTRSQSSSATKPSRGSD